MTLRPDERNQEFRDPIQSLKGFIIHNYKDLIALIIIIFCLSVLIWHSGISDKTETLLTMLTSGAFGFIFGHKLS